MLKHFIAIGALVLYGASVLYCATLVLVFRDGDWLLPLVALTLPWSLLTVIFMWSLSHGADLWFFWLLYVACSSNAG